MKRLAYLSLLFLIAFFLRFTWLLGYDFDGLYGQDAFAYYNFALSLRESILRLQMPQAFFWGLGYPILLFIFHSIFGTSAIVGQVLNIVLGAFLSPLVFSIACKLKINVFAATISALAMAFCGQAIQSSIVLMSDIPALFFCLLSAYCLLMYFQCEKSHWLILASGFLAWAVITRWIYLMLAPLWALCLLLYWRGRIRWKESIFALIIAGLILVPQWIYSTASPYPVLNHEWFVRWSPAHIAQQDFINGDGQFHYESVNALFYAAPFLNPYYLSPIFLPLIFFGIAKFLKRKNAPGNLMLFGWLILSYGFLIGIPYQNIRFSLVFAPTAAILLGAGIQVLEDKLHHQYMRGLAYLCLAIIVIFGFSQTYLVSQTVISEFIQRQEEDATVARWAKAYLPNGAVLYTFGITLRMQTYESITVYDLYYESPESLEQKWIHGQDDFILLNVWEIENQWYQREPYIAFHWLGDNRGFRLIGRHGNYALARING